MKTIIENETLLLRTWSVEDAPLLHKLNSNPEVLKYTGDEPFVDLEATLNFMQNYRDFEKYNCGRWMVVVKDDMRLIGWCGVKYHSVGSYYDLGFRLLQEEWGKGYATQASILALEYAKETLQIRKMTARSMPENTGSITVLKKLKFVYLGDELEENINWSKFELDLITDRSDKN
jgi:[ribosomal protein S5]-alanine N-acetyltransferase